MNTRKKNVYERINRLHQRLKHKLGMHDQREHGNWSKGPGMYGGEIYQPVGRRGEFLVNRAINPLASVAQEQTLFNITQRLPPKVKTGTPSSNAPMPIDSSEFEVGGAVYQYFEKLDDPFSFDPISVHEKMINYFSNDSTIQESLAYFYDVQGYNGKPTTMNWDELFSQTDDVVKDSNENPLIFYRTVDGVSNTDPNGQDRGAEFVDQMKNGDLHYPGIGVSGYGTYMKTSNIYGKNMQENTIGEYVDEGREAAVLFNDELDMSDVEENISQSLREMTFYASQASSLIYENEKMLGDVFKYSSFHSDIAIKLQKIIMPLLSELDNTNSDEIIDEMLENPYSYAKYSYIHILKFPKEFYRMSSELEDAISSNSKNMSDEEFQSITNFSVQLKKIGTQYISSHAGLEWMPETDMRNTRESDLTITRKHYGKNKPYSMGFTINQDARIPPMLVNKYRHGGSSAYKANSMDVEISQEFMRRYPMFNKSTLPDTGIMMAILGWDAYYAHIGTYSTNAVILNRAILNMADSFVGPNDNPSEYI